nr:uncharacterized protein LOC106625754 isoform X1 [Bactrocera oleae]XP_036226967.1 uncharacterized protein LOC106625754 isoform X1 [Bactrocera oleae]XP_036226968.1 uncharacterized protein LOC106625754 isoform X1 [Bactrocera oleae]
MADGLFHVFFVRTAFLRMRLIHLSKRGGFMVSQITNSSRRLCRAYRTINLVINVHNLQTLFQNQLQICMEAIVDMKLVINKWNRHIEEETSLTARIPLSSLDQIERLNAEINNDNCECKDYEITF